MQRTTKQRRTKRQRKMGPILFKILFALILLLFTLKSSFALSITQVNAPTSILEGATLSLSFTTDTPASYRMLADGVEIATADSYSETVGYDAAGLVTYTFEATAGIETVSETRQVEVLDLPLTLTILEPIENDQTSSLIPLLVETNIPADLCYAITPTGTKTLDAIDATTHSLNLTLTDGLHTLTVKCKLGAEIAEKERVLNVDTTPPSVTLAPSGTVTSDPVLEATTSELTNCRYATSVEPYVSMTAFPGGLTQSHALPLSLSAGTHTYNVLCRDVYANEAPLTSVTFTYQPAPTAEIEVEGENPHKAGTYKIDLRVSEPLNEVPSLRLTYQGGGAITLALKEENPLVYTGMLIVPEDAGELVGSFTFEGTDLEGVKGTRITAGELFIVDTIAPEKITTFRAVNGTGGVNLTWYSIDEDVRINVYRSSGLEVTYTDFLTSVSGDSYIDYDVQRATKYYYRVAAIDKAGNVGPLSHEEWASAVAARYEAEKTAQALDPLLQVGLDKELSAVSIMLLDARRVLEDLQAETAQEKIDLIADFGFIEQARASIKALESIKGELESLRSLSLSKEEFDSRMTSLKERAATARSGLVLTIMLDDRVSYEESFDDETIESAMAELLRGKTLSEEERSLYKKSATALNERVRVASTATKASFSFADGSERAVLIVSKRLLSSASEPDVLLLETLPAALSGLVLTPIKGGNPLRLNDRLLQYSFTTLSDETIVYAFDGDIDLLQARGIATILAPRPTESTGSVEGAESLLTGKAAFASAGSLLGGQGLVILFGIIIVVGLLVYYFRLQEEPDLSLATLPSSFSRSPGMASSSSLAQSFASRLMPSGATLIPASSSPTAQMATMLITRKEEGLSALLFKGHALIDENRYLDALYFYRRALERYEKEQYPSVALKGAVQQELTLLYDKIALHHTMGKGHEAAYAGDLAELSRQMEAMRLLSARVGQNESRLIERAQSEYRYLYRQFHRLKNESIADEENAADPSGTGEESL